MPSDATYFLLAGVEVGLGATAPADDGIEVTFTPLPSFDRESVLRAGSEPFHAALVAMVPGPVFELLIRFEQAGPTLPKAFASIVAFLTGLRANADVIVAATSSVSWVALANTAQNSANYEILSPLAIGMWRDHRRVTGKLSQEDVSWVFQGVENVASGPLLMDSAFNHAMKAWVQHYQQEERMGVAMMWSGVEALVGARGAEATLRTSIALAALLEPPGPSRATLQDQIMKLYNTRSNVVHGHPVSPQTLKDHVIAVRELLQRVLVKTIELGRTLNQKELLVAALEGTVAGGDGVHPGQPEDSNSSEVE